MQKGETEALAPTTKSDLCPGWGLTPAPPPHLHPHPQPDNSRRQLHTVYCDPPAGDKEEVGTARMQVSWLAWHQLGVGEEGGLPDCPPA